MKQTIIDELSYIFGGVVLVVFLVVLGWSISAVYQSDNKDLLWWLIILNNSNSQYFD